MSEKENNNEKNETTETKPVKTYHAELSVKPDKNKKNKK